MELSDVSLAKMVESIKFSPSNSSTMKLGENRLVLLNLTGLNPHLILGSTLLKQRCVITPVIPAMEMTSSKVMSLLVWIRLK
jgi:hypothetical protein